MLLNIFGIISWLTKIYDKISSIQKSIATSCSFWQTYIVSATTIWIWDYLWNTRSNKKAGYIRSLNLISLWGILFHFKWSTLGSIWSASGRFNRFSSNLVHYYIKRCKNYCHDPRLLIKEVPSCDKNLTINIFLCVIYYHIL